MPPAAVLVDGRPGSWKPDPNGVGSFALVPLPAGVPPPVVPTLVPVWAFAPELVDDAFAAAAPVVAPHTAENCAVLETCAEACAAAQTEPRIAGVIAVPSDPAPMPVPFTVEGVVALQALLALAVAGTPPLAFPTTQSEPPAPPLPPFPAASDVAELAAVDGPLPQTDETSAVGAPFASLACARKQNAAVMPAELGSLSDAPALVPEVRSAKVCWVVSADVPELSSGAEECDDAVGTLVDGVVVFGLPEPFDAFAGIAMLVPGPPTVVLLDPAGEPGVAPAAVAAVIGSLDRTVATGVVVVIGAVALADALGLPGSGCAAVPITGGSASAVELESDSSAIVEKTMTSLRFICFSSF
jgi:hypothetical protein